VFVADDDDVKMETGDSGGSGWIAGVEFGRRSDSDVCTVIPISTGMQSSQLTYPSASVV
jgi:hypothetical protein